MNGAKRTPPNPSLPAGSGRLDSELLGIVVGLAAMIASAVALAAAPLVVDDSYSWLEQAMSESAGQRVDGAWLARTGFLLHGFAFVWIAFLRRERWGQPATALLVTVAVGSFGGAAYSQSPWLPNTSYDATEDLLHQIVSAVAGLALAFGVVAVALRLRKFGHRWRALDVATLMALVIASGMMGMFPSVAGALQRISLVIVFVWYGRELLSRDEVSAGLQTSHRPGAPTA